MSSYDNDVFSASLTSTARRLRIQNYQRPESLPLERPVRPVPKKDDLGFPVIDGLNHQQMRLDAFGGFAQQERMIYDKRKTLDRALIYSYQGANIIKVREEENELLLPPKPVRALINPDKLKQDYDMKILSVPFEAHFDAGDVFHWLGTDTYWLVYLQDLTELAYFRSEIRRCCYEIVWNDEDGQRHHTYAAVRGPVETKISYIQKHGISVDRPNWSLNILLPKNEYTLKYFKRYTKFYLKDLDTCWRVEAVDSISTPGIIELSGVEYYANEALDSDFIVNNLVKEPENPNTIIEEAAISGPTFIKPKADYTYKATAPVGTWSVDQKNYPVRITIDENNPKKCTIQWTRGISGQFELSFGDYSKTIVVESLY